MYWQLDADNGMLAGYLAKDPDERRDRNGKRMVVLEISYNAMRVPQANGRRHNTIFKMPVVVYGEYVSDARLLKKGDAILAVGERPLEPPHGYTTNPMQIGKRNFGVLMHSQTTRVFAEEAAMFEKNELTKELNKTTKGKKRKIEEDDDKGFTEIKGDWY